MRRMRFNSAVAIVFLTCAYLVVACGSNTRAPVGTTTPGVTAVGMTTCFKCHADTNSPAGMKKPFGDTLAPSANQYGWLNSRHANINGSPGYADTGWVSSCALCHDPGNDGQTILSFYIGSGLSAFGTTNRPVTGCETCHGNGGNHFGVGPLQFNKPDASRCGNCHNATLSAHSTGATVPAERTGIYEDYAASTHADSVNSQSFITAGTTTSGVKGECSRCHTSEGGTLYSKIYDGASSGQASYGDATTVLSATTPMASGSAVQCKTCHDSHNPGRLLSESLPASSQVAANILAGTWSKEFATCNICHQILNADGTKNAVSYHDASVNRANPLDSSLVPVTTHIATGGDWSAGINKNNITGYTINFADRRACTNCHNPHAIKTATNRQWHASKHGGDFTAAGPWAHYNWSAANYTACQRCHTTSGAAAYLTSLANGTTYTPPLSANTAWKPEMLQCNGCHSDNKGTLRNPGAVTVSYYGDAQALADFVTTGLTPAKYPDISGSNICIACHTGRESGSSIKASSLTFTSRTSFINSHYLSAGGTVFAQTGYTYYTATSTSDPYANPTIYKHDKIGLDPVVAPNTGTNGPCVGCHMSSTENSSTNYGKHRFLPMRKDASGAVVEITSPICANCHSGQYSMTPVELEHQKTLFNAGLEALKQKLASKGFYYSATYPYWYTSTAGTTAVTVWGSTTAIGKQNMGAAFNYNLLKNDPGAFAHNRYYAKRLIYDSIDWLNAGAMNHSTPGYLNSLPDTASYRADAITYLVSATSTTDPLTGSGTTQTGGRP